jgi:hypothetical protein
MRFAMVREGYQVAANDGCDGQSVYVLGEKTKRGMGKTVKK